MMEELGSVGIDYQKPSRRLALEKNTGLIWQSCATAVREAAVINTFSNFDRYHGATITHHVVSSPHSRIWIMYSHM